MPTMAYEYYLHLRSGFIVPMQDGSMLAKEKGARTTADLQKYPVDFHINPACNATFCVADGTYLNDDGVILDITANQNIYEMSYVQDLSAADTFTLTIDHLFNATNYGTDNVVNMNDNLGNIEIYNAAAQGFSAANNYTVQGTKLDGTTQTQFTFEMYYETTSDRLVADRASDEEDILLPAYASLLFTKKA